MKKIIITGGAGFIGRWVVKKALEKNYHVTVLDKLTYSGNLSNLSEFEGTDNFNFVKGDICSTQLVKKLLKDIKPSAIIHLAAESHVDNSISGPAPFIQTNLVGTYNLLENSRQYLAKLDAESASSFRFIHVSTDEVYGSLTKDEKKFSKDTSYAPNSPYSATKAGSDFLARAWFETYSLPVIITNCSNNYGPFQHEEKLIPKTITNALQGLDIPVYGKGLNIRDWIYVEDHADGLLLTLENGLPGEKYLFGGDNEIKNIDLVNKICIMLQQINGRDYKKQIKFVIDRLGHDFRYAIDCEYSKKTLGFSNLLNFDDRLKTTIEWYINKIKKTT